MPAPARTASNSLPLTLPAAGPRPGQPVDAAPPNTLQLLQRWTPATGSSVVPRATVPACAAPRWALWLRRRLALG